MVATEEHVAGPWRRARPPALTVIISPLGGLVTTVNVNNVINARDDGWWRMRMMFCIIDRIDPVIQIQLQLLHLRWLIIFALSIKGGRDGCLCVAIKEMESLVVGVVRLLTLTRYCCYCKPLRSDIVLTALLLCHLNKYFFPLKYQAFQLSTQVWISSW